MLKEKEFSFGKISYRSKRKINEVTLEITLRDWNGYPEFTACVKVWNMTHTDIVAGGQCVDDLYNKYARFRYNTLYRTIFELWEKYHCKDITDIPEEDRRKIDLLFSDIDRKELIEELKAKNQE